MAKENKFKPLSEFEYDCIWMSYRYCIGRHTITAHSHASDIAVNAYDRLNPDQREQTANDINMCIYDSMRFSFFKIDNFDEKRHFPLDIFYQFINEEKISSYDELKKYDRVKAVYDSVNEKWTFERKLADENSSGHIISRMMFDDLGIWQILAKLLKNGCHKIAQVKQPQSIVTHNVEYYDIYEQDCNFKDYIYYKVYKRPVSNKVLSVNYHINEDYIL